MNQRLSWLAAALLLCPLGAQEQTPTDAKTRLQELQVEQQEALKTWRENMRKQAEEWKKNPDTRPRSIAMRPDYGPMRGKYMTAANKYSGDDAVMFLMAALNVSSSRDQYREIIDRLLGSHLDSPGLGQLGAMLPRLGRMVGDEYATQTVAKIKEHGKNPSLMGWIAFQEHEQTFRSESPKSEQYVTAKAIVSKAVELANHVGLTRQFDQLIAETEKFGMGMVAPDIAGPDLDGVEFKLSDYKGKVVFLDFWGDW